MIDNKCEMCDKTDRPSMDQWIHKLDLSIGRYKRTFWLCDDCSQRMIELVELTMTRVKKDG